jgi:serine/threonine protein phosphatase PrpC
MMMMRLDVGYGTHQGRVRPINQDSVGVFGPPRRFLQRRSQPTLFVVADGMGGHRSGEIASQTAVESIRTAFFQEIEETSPANALKSAIIAANEAVKARAARSPETTGMGTTIVAAATIEKTVFFANVGDSRGYLISRDKIRQITEDHSLVAEQVRMGIITEDEALEGHRNVITRAVGRREDLEVDIFEEQWEPGDTFILCSDGLWDQVSESQMAMVLYEMEAQPAARKLIEMAMTAQAPDNVSVVIVRRVA